MTKHFSPTYTTKKCADLTQLDCFESSHLFSANYGRWSGKDKPEKKGQRIKLGVGYYERLKTKEDMYVSFCHEDGLLIGACFFLKKRLVNGQICVWITQLVVDSSYRKKGIATRLLQSAWGFSDYFAWGLATANTLTIKTLESVTWHKVDPSIICDNLETIDRLCESLPYRTGSKTIEQGKSIIDTNFFIDRDIHETTEDIYVERLGNLPDGCEWLAFTFQTQDMYFDEKHFNEFIEFSAEQLNDAYSRMDLSHQTWAQGTKKEIDYIETLLGIGKGNSILDVGCGQGRHSIELAKRGYYVVGIDASEKHIQKAHASAENLPVRFSVWDARKRFPGRVFDAVICLYDVIGSYRELNDNLLIVKNIARKLRKGGRAIISVMNRTHIELRAIHRGKVNENPRLLLELPSSNSMQSTGDMFNAKYQLLDESHNLVYHKEQFEQDGMLSAEYIVADYRFRQSELRQILADNGLQVIESRFVRAGHFEESLPEEHDNAKEILFVVEKQ